MLYSSDRTGFPLLHVRALGLSVSVVPVAKLQFEIFMADTGAFGDTWYDEVLRFGPRLSWRIADGGPHEDYFIRGLLPSEALAYAKWLGDGFDVPTLEEWRAIYRTLSDRPVADHAKRTLLDGEMHPAADAILRRVLREARPQTWAQLLLMDGGLFEWVRDGRAFKGLGKPRHQFHPSVLHPLNDEPVRPVGSERSPLFGVRLVRRDDSPRREVQ